MDQNLKSSRRNCSSGWKAVFGCNLKSLAIFRISIGFLLLLELLLRFRFLHPFYTDEGTFPTRLLLPKIDTLYRIICIHAFSGSIMYQRFLLSIQVIFATFLIVGYKTRLSSILSWYLYLSLTLRNTWLNFILDRYFHYMLFYTMFLPTSSFWSVDAITSDENRCSKHNSSAEIRRNQTVVSLATIAIKAQVCWIYLDAGQGKYNDPLGGWSLNADPLPALDTYARHTLIARYMYALLTPVGLRLMTPTVVYAELLAAPVTLLGSYIGNRALVLSSIGIICSLHIGIALTVRNTALLSSVACAAWGVFLPTFSSDYETDSENGSQETKSSSGEPRSSRNKAASIFIIISIICGSIWFETISEECNQSMKHIWSVLLHNRWNVFVGAEEYVTWEIAPGRLADGSIVDVWGRTDSVAWDMPGTGAPCTSTARPGRWRSFPYLAELDGEDGEALWSYLCRQWDEENGVKNGENDGRKLLRYNFFMLQADVLPEMGFSATRKRLIHAYDCAKLDLKDNDATGENIETNSEL
mmetsp:Transcript_31393/g.36094  ORF Transcript_31393/g.36094 Transcript_31393/m.36094 type:complete len:527 (+) Transcript_31393:79-1659(+)